MRLSFDPPQSVLKVAMDTIISCVRLINVGRFRDYQIEKYSLSQPPHVDVTYGVSNRLPPWLSADALSPPPLALGWSRLRRSFLHFHDWLVPFILLSVDFSSVGQSVNMMIRLAYAVPTALKTWVSFQSNSS